jgi:hypothetical protein
MDSDDPQDIGPLAVSLGKWSGFGMQQLIFQPLARVSCAHDSQTREYPAADR